MASKPKPFIFGSEVDVLLTRIEESTRSNQEAVRYFVEPAQGVLQRALSKRHHIMFGRRGSGKSSLLGKTYAEQLVQRRPCAMVDLEEFKGHSYPDVLVSVLIKSFYEFKRWVDAAATAPTNKRSFWNIFTANKPASPKLTKEQAQLLSARLQKEIAGLEAVLHGPDEANIEETRNATRSGSAKLAGSTEVGLDGAKATISGEYSEADEVSRGTKSAYASKKTETLHRNIMQYKAMFRDIAAASGGDAFLLLDDLYHIRSSDQADVLDHFHRIAKGGNLWLKVGTIRHRSRWYIAGDPPTGMKLGDDIDEIDLDVTLEKYQTSKSFLLEVLEEFATEAEVSLPSILTDGARDRLVLSSGGVARDFLGLFRRAVAETRERILNKELARGEKVGSEDVNRAAGSYYENKAEELNLDTDEQSRREVLSYIDSVKSFCIDKSGCNCLLVEKDIDAETRNMIGELVDLKFIHHVKSRVTVRGRDKKVFDAFMLDFSFYTGERTRRGFETIEFWKPANAEALRKANLIYREAA